MRGGHLNDGDQRNVGSYHFLTRDIALLSRWRITLDSSAVHALDATFKIFAAHHGHLLLDCCHAGTHARSVRRLAGRTFIPRTRSTAGHVAVFCCIPGCHEAAKSERVRRRRLSPTSSLPLKSALAHKRTRAVLMPEMAHAREDHGKAGVVGGGDDLVVAHRAAGLDHGSRADFRDHLQTVGKGKEGV
jgi:hypothetical protein